MQDGGVSSLDLAAKFGIGHNESVGKPTALSVDEGHLYSSFFSYGHVDEGEHQECRLERTRIDLAELSAQTVHSIATRERIQMAEVHRKEKRGKECRRQHESTPSSLDHGLRCFMSLCTQQTA